MKKLYIGCGPSPVHPQHMEILGNPDQWTFIDLFVKEPHIKNWDGRYLNEVEDGTVDEIYSSHTLEHFEHGQVPEILKTWHRKLKEGGKLTINVPDLIWAFNRLQRVDSGAPLEAYFDRYAGEHGVMSIIYGSQSHDGEYHKGGFTEGYLHTLLTMSGFNDIKIEQKEDAHDMGVLISVCRR